MTLCTGSEKQYQVGTGMQLEHGVLHCLPDGDTETRAPHYRLPCNPMEDWETP